MLQCVQNIKERRDFYNIEKQNTILTRFVPQVEGAVNDSNLFKTCQEVTDWNDEDEAQFVT